MLRDLAVRGGLTGCVIVGLAGDAAGQGSVSGGAREILSIGFASGVMPREIRSPSSGLVVVDKDGVRMLRASTASEFRVQLPEQLPANFTLEFDLIAKECFCDPADLRFEGRAGSSQSDVYAEVQWSPTHQSVVGGATHNPGPFTATTPPSLSETLRGQSARIVVGFEGNVIRLYTNGTRLYTVSDRQFARTNVLRVSLGGQDEGGDAVFLARIRVAEGTVTTGPAIAQDPGGRFSPTGRETSTASSPPPSPPPPAPTRPPPGTALPPVPPPPPPAPPEPAPAPAAPAPPPAPAPAPVPSPAGVAGVVAQVDAQGTVSVSWQAVTGATSYFVVRWLVGDNVCCGNTSPPEGIASLTWRDGVLPKAGTYGYRVYATLPSVISTGETTVGYQPPAAAAPASPRAPVPQTIKLTGVAGTGGAGTGLPPRRIALQGFTSSGAYVHVVVASRTIATPVITATGSLRSVAKSGSVTAAAPVPETIAVGAVTASGEYGARIVANQTIPLAAITATAGGVVVVPPRTIELVGVTAVGSTKTSTKIQ